MDHGNAWRMAYANVPKPQDLIIVAGFITNTLILIFGYVVFKTKYIELFNGYK